MDHYENDFMNINYLIIHFHTINYHTVQQL